jgi:hypothetical protein
MQMGGQLYAPAALATEEEPSVGSHSQSRRCEDKNLFTLPRIKNRLLDSPTPSLVPIPTELSWILQYC